MAAGSGISAQFGVAEEVYANEVQTITGTPSGTFGVTYDGANTVTTLATNCTAAAMQTALEALPNVGVGGIVCAGGPLSTTITCTFSGATVQKRNVPVMAVQGSVTGLTFATTTPGTGYGDYVTVTRFYEFPTEGINQLIDVIRSAAITQGGLAERSARAIEYVKGAGGAVGPFDVLTKGFGLLLQYAGCFTTSITTPATGVTTRDMTMTLDASQNWNKSLCAQKGVPRVTGSTGNVDAFSYVGGKITAWDLSCSVGGLLQLGATFDFKNEDLTQSLASPSYPASTVPLSFVGGVVTINGMNADVRDFKISGAHTYDLERRYLRQSSLKKEPVPTAMQKLTGTVTMDYDGPSRAVYNLFKAGTRAQIVATWQGPLIEGALHYQLSVTLPACRISGDTPNVAGRGIVGQVIPFEVEWDDTNEPITVVYRTTDSVI